MDLRKELDAALILIHKLRDERDEYKRNFDELRIKWLELQEVRRGGGGG